MWTESQSEVLAFARVLDNAGFFGDPGDVIYYFEKPWKWDNEHTAWVGFGSPQDATADGWELFAKALEKQS